MKKSATKRRKLVLDNGSSFDRISELPQALLQHIHYLLPPKQAVQSILLSKSWRNNSSYNRPNIDLNEDSFHGTKTQFLSLVHNTLHGYHDHKLRINEFRLELSEPNSESISLLEEWIPVVIHTGVKIFHLRIKGSSRTIYYYDWSDSVFESESIVDLSLQGCCLERYTPVMFKHLKVLRLYQVVVEDYTFDTIISSCPLVEVIELENCKYLRIIRLDNLRNLKEFSFSSSRINGDRHTTSIEWGAAATNVKSVTICGHVNWFRNFIKSKHVFVNLKDLSLTRVCLFWISFSDFSTYFPSLENVKFSDCDEFEQIMIVSRSIQHVSFTEINRSIKAHIDVPNIRSFEYSGCYIPVNLSFAKTHSKWKSDICLDLYEDDSLWLLRLKEMLTGGLSQSEITLGIYERPNRHRRRLLNWNNDHKIVHNFEPVEVEELRFAFLKKQDKPSKVLDDLFSVCRPKIIVVCWYVKDGIPERNHNEFMEEVCKILMERDQTSIGTQEYSVTQRNWQNYLKEVALNIYDDNLREWRPLDGATSRKCALRNIGCQHDIRFLLTWRKDVLAVTG